MIGHGARTPRAPRKSVKQLHTSDALTAKVQHGLSLHICRGFRVDGPTPYNSRAQGESKWHSFRALDYIGPQKHYMGFVAPSTMSTPCLVTRSYYYSRLEAILQAVPRQAGGGCFL